MIHLAQHIAIDVLGGVGRGVVVLEWFGPIYILQIGCGIVRKQRLCNLAEAGWINLISTERLSYAPFNGEWIVKSDSRQCISIPPLEVAEVTRQPLGIGNRGDERVGHIFIPVFILEDEEGLVVTVV